MLLTKERDLEFLQKKIQEINLALFRPEMNSIIRLPNDIISTIQTDNDGHIWFYASALGFHSKNIDRHFPAHLEYYKKGANSHLRIKGTASMIEKDNNYSNTPMNGRLVLIKFKIMQAEYFENWESTVSPQSKWLHFISGLLMPKVSRHFDFTRA